MVGSDKGYRCDRCEMAIDIDRTVALAELVGARPMLTGGLALGTGTMAQLAAVLPGVPVPFIWLLAGLPIVLTAAVAIDGVSIGRRLDALRQRVHPEALTAAMVKHERTMVLLGLFAGGIGVVSGLWVGAGLLSG
jgi:hypothetical protein